MKIIFSRKGFDSSDGGSPSIILPDEKTMISFPIPVHGLEEGDAPENILYKNENKTLKDYLDELKIRSDSKYHVDPEIQNLSVNKSESFFKRGYGTFGQCSSAAGHLFNNDIKPHSISEKDPALFLFFGLFSKTRINDEGLLVRDGKSFHCFFGYLKATEAIIVSDSIPNDMKTHPHYRNRNHKEYIKGGKNVIYRGAEFGVFKYSDKLRLTVENSDKVTNWAIPDCIKAMTYNNNRIKNGKKENNKIIINSASRGQEFVITDSDEEKMKDWLNNLGINL